MLSTNPLESIEFNLAKYEETKNPAFLWCIVQHCTTTGEEMPLAVIEYLKSVSDELLKPSSEEIAPKLKRALRIDKKIMLNELLTIREVLTKKRKIDIYMKVYGVSQNNALNALANEINIGGGDDSHYVTKKNRVKHDEEFIKHKISDVEMDRIIKAMINKHSSKYMAEVMKNPPNYVLGIINSCPMFICCGTPSQITMQKVCKQIAQEIKKQYGAEIGAELIEYADRFFIPPTLYENFFPLFIKELVANHGLSLEDAQKETFNRFTS